MYEMIGVVSGPCDHLSTLEADQGRRTEEGIVYRYFGELVNRAAGALSDGEQYRRLGFAGQEPRAPHDPLLRHHRSA